MHLGSMQISATSPLEPAEGVQEASALRPLLRRLSAGLSFSRMQLGNGMQIFRKSTHLDLRPEGSLLGPQGIHTGNDEHATGEGDLPAGGPPRAHVHDEHAFRPGDPGGPPA